ncbi:MAG: DUF_B2219 domain-containing protein [Balneolaceae bacterium]|nr:DUF_B2219 domain-containing protein [Balneolaceae bacterium]
MSPLDPIFWTHHNMIDCLWADWNIHRQNPNTNDNQWTQYDFSSSFVDRAGNPVSTNVISTVLMPLLSYRFEDCFGTTSTGSAEAEQDTTQVIGAQNTTALRKFLREGAPVELEFIDRVRVEQQVRVVPNEPMTVYMNLDRDSFRRILSQDETAKILLTVGDVQLPEASDIFMRVFVNMPEASADTPLDDPHYAGSFAFFVDPEAHQEEHEPPDYLVNITNALYRLRREGILGDSQLSEVGIQLVAVPFPNREIRAKAIGLNFLDVGIVRTNERQNQQ